MNEHIGAMGYGNARGSADLALAAAGLATLAGFYASAEAALAAANAPGACAVLVGFDGGAGNRATRADLSCAVVGSSKNVDEDLYLVSPTELDGVKGVQVEKVADLTWTSGSTAIPTAAGGRTNHLRADSVTVSATGVLLARTRFEIAAGGGVATVYDVGRGRHLLRVLSIPASAGATGAAPMHALWK